ncbi:DUF2752 domain-containing protein [Mariniflexile ostreae]|uniref:DUF2752 domain-containing protein n=1 Tax=Mariniflexile ostreae TaxID=1520892 RepID=A0ABV5FEL4_9FLAO
MISIETYMLPCLNKKFFGFDCMGCGTQRSLSLMFHGEFTAAFYMYPAIYTLLILLGFSILNAFNNYRFASKIIIPLAIINVILIVGSFIFKIFLNTH